jgi:hypothetical protein
VELASERVFETGELPGYVDERWSDAGSLVMFGDDGSGLSALVIEPTAWQRLDVGDGSGDSLVVVPLDSASSVISDGAPLLTWNGSLVGITTQADPMSVTVRDASGVTQTVEVAVFRQYSLMDPPLGAPAPELSAAHWIQQVRLTLAKNDGNGDGFEDLWGNDADYHLVFQPMAGTASAGPLEEQYSVHGLVWSFVGRGAMGPGGVTDVWRNHLTGGVYMVVYAEPLVEFSFSLDPEWEIAALADIDGDGVDDFLLHSELYNDSYYFWLMEPVRTVDVDEAATNPAVLVRYGQWFFGPSAGVRELAAAGHFTTGVAGSGGEQAAADLLWRDPATGDVTLWEMTANRRACTAADDPVLQEACATYDTGELLTYDFVFSVDQPAMPTYWTPAGVSDFNTDGVMDVAWHASGAAAPTDDYGHVRLWLGDSLGGFTPVDVLDAADEPLFVDPEDITLGG